MLQQRVAELVADTIEDVGGDEWIRGNGCELLCKMLICLSAGIFMMTFILHDIVSLPFFFKLISQGHA